jgi:hypothetical protein
MLFLIESEKNLSSPSRPGFAERDGAVNIAKPPELLPLKT